MQLTSKKCNCVCLSSFLSFFFLFFLVIHATTAHNVVYETCKKNAQRDPNLDYKFCVTSLQSIPRSHNASLHQLGIISINLTRSNVTRTRSYIKKLLKQNNEKLDDLIRACLDDCFDLYSDAVRSLKQAVKDYKSKHYEDANFQVSSVMNASTTCEFGFTEKQGVVSPLTKRNNDTFQLSAIALLIINMPRMQAIGVHSMVRGSPPKRGGGASHINEKNSLHF